MFKHNPEESRTIEKKNVQNQISCNQSEKYMDIDDWVFAHDPYYISSR